MASRIPAVFVAQIILFVALSLADLVQTRHLLTRCWPWVYEGNPVAAWVLGAFGWPGLAAFKALSVLVVAGTAAALWRRRPRAGAGVLTFGCLTLAGVVLYSSLLPGAAQALDRAGPDDEAATLEHSRRLDRAMNDMLQHDALKRELLEELTAGRCDLPEALERFVTAPAMPTSVWLRGLHELYHLPADRDCLAANFVHHALKDVVLPPDEHRRRARQWLGDYRARYRVPDPPPWRGLGLDPGS
jgi:hypothetical protein